MLRLDRADNVPIPLLPFISAFWLLWTIWLITAHAILHLTCRIDRIYLDESYKSNQPYIYCCWHENITGYLVSFWTFTKPHVIIINYDWFMPPVHWFAKRMLTKHIVKFFPQETNKKAADEAIRYLKDGCSQFHLPDGPRGPLRSLKKGILHMAAESGTPVVPVKVHVSRAMTFPMSWDKKRVPLPFSKITLTFAKPIVITSGNFDEAEILLLSGLG